MTKAKRNKAKYWCHACALMGYRNPLDAQINALKHRRKAFPCPSGEGWHFS